MTKTKDLFGDETEDTYDPRSLSFYNGLSTIEDTKSKEQLSFFDYIFNKLSTKE